MENNNGRAFFGGIGSTSSWNSSGGPSVPGYAATHQHNIQLGMPPNAFNQQSSTWNGYQWTHQFPNFHSFPPPPAAQPMYQPVPQQNYSLMQPNVANSPRQVYQTDHNIYGRQSDVNDALPDAIAHQVSEEKSQRAKDQEYLNVFLRQHCTKTPVTPEIRDTNELKISEGQHLLGKCLVFIDTLKTLHSKLNSNLDTDESSWESMTREAVRTKLQVENVMKQLTPDKLKCLKSKLKARAKKRKGQKQQAELAAQRKLEQRKRTDFLHDKINVWQESIKLEHMAAIMEKKMKTEADSVLMEVRRKRSEATKMLDLVRAVAKLRAIKNQSKSKDLHVPVDCDETFSKVSQQLEEMLTGCLSEYAEEERALQVMLDVEQQETRESVQKKRNQERLQIAERRCKETHDILFGQEVIWDSDPLFPYYDYHTGANKNLQTLTQVRRCWDRWLVPTESQVGSGIPVSWVVPVRPSSEAWAQHLQTA